MLSLEGEEQVARLHTAGIVRETAHLERGEVRRQVRFQRNSGKDPTKRHKNGCWMLDVG